MLNLPDTCCTDQSRPPSSYVCLSLLASLSYFSFTLSPPLFSFTLLPAISLRPPHLLLLHHSPLPLSGAGLGMLWVTEATMTMEETMRFRLLLIILPMNNNSNVIYNSSLSFFFFYFFFFYFFFFLNNISIFVDFF